MKKLLFVIFCLASITVAMPSFAWDGVGHELVAQIAYDRLTPSAKAQVDHLSAALNSDAYTIELAAGTPFNQITIATWPDEIRSLGAETRKYSAWHYIDLDELPPVKFTADKPNLPGTPIADSASISVVKAYSNPRSDVYEQILAQAAILKDKTAPTADRARALAYVEHFVGDIHQPLHAVGRQRGGNSYAIDLTVNGREITNLHSFWDGAYRYHVDNETITVDPYYPAESGASPDKGSIKAWSDSLVKELRSEDPQIMKQSDPAAWAVESAEYGSTFAFPADNTPTLSNTYVERAADIARERIALAGVRLAQLLNSCLGNS